MRRYVVLVAGGTGTRMKSEIPKQFLSFAGKPVLIHTIERFYKFDNDIGIILVLPETSVDFWNRILLENPLPSKVEIAAGGDTRAASTLSGLTKVPDDSIVAIHDAVRPLLSVELIRRCFFAAEKFGNACPAIIPVDSLRRKTDDQSESVNRDNYLQVQTPQVFKASLLKSAFEKMKTGGFMDEASLFEAAGNIIYIVEGERWNIKITYPEDLIIAEALSLQTK